MLEKWDWHLDSEVAGISALVAADAAAFLSAFNPSLFTIRAFRSSTRGNTANETAKDIYRGIALGAGLTLLTGFGGSAVSGSWWPIASASVTLAIIALAYYWALQNPRGTGGIADQ